jgi:hypothetical protein
MVLHLHGASEAALFYKTVLLDIDGTLVPFIGLRPGFHAVQVAGKPARENPFERLMGELGWHHQRDLDELVPEPDLRYVVTLLPGRRYRFSFNGEVWHETAHPQPAEWIDAVLEQRLVVAAYYPDPGTEVRGAEVAQALQDDRCRLVAARLGRSAFGE